MKQEIMPFLEKIVSFHTIEGENDTKRECLEWILETFLDHTDLPLVRGEVREAPYLLIEHPEPKLLWFAHTDVVPGAREQFAVERKGDKLYGRGTKDMKGACIPFLLAYRDACAQGNLPPISILLTSDEETAGPTIPTLLGEGEMKKVPVAFTPDTGSNPHIVVEHKGVCWADMKVVGVGGHSALPWNTTNPTIRLAEALLTLNRLFPTGTLYDWQMTVSPTMLSGSVSRNQIPSIAQCSIDIRFPPEMCATPDGALTIVQEALPSYCELTKTVGAEPLRTDPAHPMVQFVKRLADEVTGEDTEIGREHGSTDARYFGAVGIPAFLYGPRGGGIHGSDEWVSLKSLKEQYEFSKRLIAELS